MQTQFSQWVNFYALTQQDKMNKYLVTGVPSCHIIEWRGAAPQARKKQGNQASARCVDSQVI